MVSLASQQVNARGFLWLENSIDQTGSNITDHKLQGTFFVKSKVKQF